MSRGLLEDYATDAYIICVLIFLIQAYIVGTHLNYLDKFIKAYVVGTHLNCLDLLRQFR